MIRPRRPTNASNDAAVSPSWHTANHSRVATRPITQWASDPRAILGHCEAQSFADSANDSFLSCLAKRFHLKVGRLLSGSPRLGIAGEIIQIPNAYALRLGPRPAARREKSLGSSAVYRYVYRSRVADAGPKAELASGLTFLQPALTTHRLGAKEFGLPMLVVRYGVPPIMVGVLDMTWFYVLRDRPALAEPYEAPMCLGILAPAIFRQLPLWLPGGLTFFPIAL